VPPNCQPAQRIDFRARRETATHRLRHPGVLIIVFFFGGFAIGQYAGALTGLYQRVTIVTGWTWIAAIAWHLIRPTSADPTPAKYVSAMDA
jgi:hypothetical protein